MRRRSGHGSSAISSTPRPVADRRPAGNRDLKLFGRPGETAADFATRCASTADDLADKETAALRDKYADKVTRLQSQIQAAEDRAEVLDTEREGPAQRGAAVHGRLDPRRSARRAAKPRRVCSDRCSARPEAPPVGARATAAAGDRVDAAHNKVEDLHRQLEDLETELTGDVTEIDSQVDGDRPRTSPRCRSAWNAPTSRSPNWPGLDSGAVDRSMQPVPALCRHRCYNAGMSVAITIRNVPDQVATSCLAAAAKGWSLQEFLLTELSSCASARPPCPPGPHRAAPRRHGAHRRTAHRGVRRRAPMIAVDANAVVALLVDDADLGGTSRRLYAEHDLAAPDLLPYEVASVLRKLTR